MSPTEVNNQRILISPLNWGMGHVSRCIGLIQQLKAQGNTVFVACNPEQKAIFEQYFEDVTFVHHEGYPFFFGGKGRFSFDLLKAFRKLSRRKKKERDEIDQLCSRYGIDLVLSDHRYGFKSSNTHSVFITHQLNLPLSWYEFPVKNWHKQLIRAFDEVWVMDFQDSRLAGKLSMNNDANKVSYVGPYSRFMWDKKEKEKEIDTVAVLSGPTIYAQQLANSVVTREKSDEIVFILPPGVKVPEGYKVIEGDWRKQDEVLRTAKKIISRSGYSTIMDLYWLGANFEMFPTPGQSEQEYLSTFHSK